MAVPIESRIENIFCKLCAEILSDKSNIEGAIITFLFKRFSGDF